MRDGWKSRWGWRISAVVLVGGVLALGTGTGVTQAGERDDDHNKRNPFERILAKLDKILDAVKGGGRQDGNHTLRWDHTLPAAQRFVVLNAFNNEAVLDKNTGLVWEQAPEATTLEWSNAKSECLRKNVGGTVGWRLPSVVELKSVQDPSLPVPYVSASVFTGILPLVTYWSATTVAEAPDTAWMVASGDNGSVFGLSKFGATHF
jgi:Protein of unknown function (DUF1566)